jgi:hypothetical protein
MSSTSHGNENRYAGAIDKQGPYAIRFLFTVIIDRKRTIRGEFESSLTVNVTVYSIP